ETAYSTRRGNDCRRAHVPHSASQHDLNVERDYLRAPTPHEGSTGVTEEASDSAISPIEAKDRLEQALFEIRRIIAGQDAMLERVLVCLLAQGHLLIEGVPGLA